MAWEKILLSMWSLVTCAIRTRKEVSRGDYSCMSIKQEHQWKGYIDFLGPLPKTPRGNEHILMMVDQFTKWVECVPLPSQTAEVTAKAAIDGFFSRFGYPFQIFPDQGRNFESKLFTALCDALEIHKARTTPYRASSKWSSRTIQQNFDGCGQMFHQGLARSVGSSPATDCGSTLKFGES